jgi:hypothetical protein
MYNYDLKPLADALHREKLREAQERHLAERLREHHKASSVRGSVCLALANVLSLVRGA